MTLNKDQFGEQLHLFNPDDEFLEEWPAAGEDIYATTHHEARENAQQGYVGSRPVHTGSGVFMGNITSPIEREEFQHRRYYHGSPIRMNEGDLITPGAEHGREHFGLGRNRSVFMTADQDEAAGWAGAALRESPHLDDLRRSGFNRYVYEVEPHGFNEEHPNIAGGGEFQARSARIVRAMQVHPVNEEFDDDDEDQLYAYEHLPRPQTEHQGKLF